jgi:hypothetical protein
MKRSARHVRRRGHEEVSKRLTPRQGWQGSTFARVRSRPARLEGSPANTQFERTGANGANGRSHLPCRRSWVRVPSSDLVKAPLRRGSLLPPSATHRRCQHSRWATSRGCDLRARRSAARGSACRRVAAAIPLIGADDSARVGGGRLTATSGGVMASRGIVAAAY